MPETNRELDVRLAEALGWTEIEVRLYPGTPVKDAWGRPPEYRGESALRLPRYSTDLNAMAEVEAEIGRRGIEVYAEYIKALCRQLQIEDDPVEPWVWPEAWALITASAEMRARAAVRVLGGE